MGDPQYFLNMHVGGQFECKPTLVYIGGEVVRVKEDPDTFSYFKLEKIVKNGLLYNTVYSIRYKVLNSDVLEGNLKVVWNDETTIDMLNLWYATKEIDLYVEHEYDVSQEEFELIHGPLSQEGSKKLLEGPEEQLKHVESDEVEVGDEEGLEDIEVGDVEVEWLEDIEVEVGDEKEQPKNVDSDEVVVGDVEEGLEEQPKNIDSDEVEVGDVEEEASYQPVLRDEDVQQFDANQPIPCFEECDEAVDQPLQDIAALNNDGKSQAGPSEPRREGKQLVVASDNDNEHLKSHCEVDEEVYENFHYMSDGEFDEEFILVRKKSRVAKNLKAHIIEEDLELPRGVQDDSL